VKIYTKTGDTGETGLWGGFRVSKDALRVHAYGAVDELNAAVGVARASNHDEDLDVVLGMLQEQLFVVGADLASPNDSPHIPRIGEADIEELERQIDALELELTPLQQFILPGGGIAAASLHSARTVCRRAERWAVSLGRSETINELVRYLNRLSDLLFVLARVANARSGITDIPWHSPRLSTR
jgi:cob(I)alamin adenosyltransferase